MSWSVSNFIPGSPWTSSHLNKINTFSLESSYNLLLLFNLNYSPSIIFFLFQLLVKRVFYLIFMTNK